MDTSSVTLKTASSSSSSEPPPSKRRKQDSEQQLIPKKITAPRGDICYLCQTKVDHGTLRGLYLDPSVGYDVCYYCLSYGPSMLDVGHHLDFHVIFLDSTDSDVISLCITGEDSLSKSIIPKFDAFFKEFIKVAEKIRGYRVFPALPFGSCSNQRPLSISDCCIRGPLSYEDIVKQLENLIVDDKVFEYFGRISKFFGLFFGLFPLDSRRTLVRDKQDTWASMSIRSLDFIFMLKSVAARLVHYAYQHLGKYIQEEK